MRGATQAAPDLEAACPADHGWVFSGGKRQALVPVGVVLLFFAGYSIAGLAYYWSFLTHYEDIALFDHVVWSTLHGRFFQTTLGINFFAIHSMPILAAFVPIYALSPRAEWLILAQGFALAVTFLPVYRLAFLRLGSRAAAAMLGLAVLVNPYVLSAVPWAFHAETLAVPFIAAGFLAVERKRFGLLVLCSVVILLCKEHFGLCVAGFGILWGIRWREWGRGSVLVTLGAFHIFLVFGRIIPAFSPTGRHLMLSEGMGHFSRYSWLGHSVGEIIFGTLKRLPFVLKTVFIHFGGAKYLMGLLLLFFGAPLAAPSFLLPGCADLAANLLSAVPMPRGIAAYHTATLVPVLACAAVYGCRRYAEMLRNVRPGVFAAAILAVNIGVGYIMAPLPLPGSLNLWRPWSLTLKPDPRVDSIREIIGQEATISVQGNVAAHFTHVKRVFPFPKGVDEAEYIILYLQPTTHNLHYPDEWRTRRQGMLVSFDAFLNVDRTEYFQALEGILNDGRHIVIYWDDPWLVLRPSPVRESPHSAPEGISQALSRLKTLTGD
ncbi:MAG: DUF2079 domain-containing protein [Desulfosoma sp.]